MNIFAPFNSAIVQRKYPYSIVIAQLYLPLIIALILLMGTPALAQTISYGAVEGIYVLCPRKNVERCPVAVDEFRHFFPNRQVGAFMMLRSNKTGYLAPDNDRTWDLTWNRDSKGLLVVSFNDSRKTDLVFEVNGSLLKDMEEGDLYYMAITDQEWNNPPKKKKRVKR